MSMFRISYEHSLALAVIQDYVWDLGRKMELLSQARIYWKDDATRRVLVFRGPNVEGQFEIFDRTLEASMRLGPALRIVVETMRKVFEVEMKRAVKPDA